DSLVSPLFYFFLGSLVSYGVGVAFALVYKAVNTLDSMIGYRTEDLRNFGFLAARLDDLLNWLPSRISVLFVSLGALSWNTFAVAFRDWDCARSPNSGWPMAAAAGALEVKLVKKGEYSLGEEYKLPEEEDLRLAIRLAVRTILLYLVMLLGVTVLL
ncbi:cobalamin biosynthesis protein, partial [Candidatus Bipolaricaulota bacterium]|nr:cobalamin biosynthesis protein [Candidatus Bipolaricaulota bacterium]